MREEYEYKLEQLPALFDEMSELMKGPYDREKVNEFVGRHPWTLKYLCSGFSEAEQLREFAEKESFTITLQAPHEIETKFRELTRRAKVVKYVTPLGNPRQFVFIFENSKADLYRALNY